ncbi:MAG: peptidoglycan glycosyltransferase [Roseiflexaceae bacterium]|nr:peptidoglycan glycosyltransferase [Roseiflexaceae bacterium]
MYTNMINRLIVTRIAIVLLFAVLVGRLYELQIANSETRELNTSAGELANRPLQVRPQRGEVFAADGRTLLAESVPIFTAAIRPSALPGLDADLYSGEPRRDQVFAQLGQILGITSTLTISPANLLDTAPLLQNDLAQGLGASALATSRVEQVSDLNTATWLRVDVPPARSLIALQIQDTYSDTVRLHSPIAERVNRGDLPVYQTFPIKRDIPRNIALVLRENANNLPGVVIERDWTRRYPLSAAIPTFSHLLGYVGSVGTCDLVRNNAARTWLDGMLDSIGHAVECGAVRKQIDPLQLVPRYLNEDRIGRGGIEEAYEQELRGQLGLNSVVVGPNGRAVDAPRVLQQANDGSNIVLTIDTGLQKQVEQILQNWIDISDQRRQAFDGVFDFKRSYPPIKSGVAVVTEIKTGRVLAMVSLPSYDNNIWIDATRSEELMRILAPPSELVTETRRLNVLYNRAVSFPYPAGSTLKQFDAVIALQNGVIKPDTQIFDPGQLLVENRYNPEIKDAYVNANSKANGWLDVYKALEVSSNVFFMSAIGGNKEQVINLQPEEQTIERGVGPDKFREGLEMFGMGGPTGIRLPGENLGVVPSPAWKSAELHEEFTTGDLYNMAIGQGHMRVTPLQLNMAGAAVANGGKLYQPQIVDRVVTSNGELIEQFTPQLKTDMFAEYGISPAYFQIARAGMRRSVTDGPNKAARLECSGLQIAGKTGTAEFGEPFDVPDGKGKTKPALRSHAWFVGFAPYDDPQIQVTVLVEGAGDMGDGSATIAVPATTQIMQAYFNTTPPAALPSCQQDLPPLPARQSFAPLPPSESQPVILENARGR